jgi:hypothetical protein
MVMIGFDFCATIDESFVGWSRLDLVFWVIYEFGLYGDVGYLVGFGCVCIGMRGFVF